METDILEQARVVHKAVRLLRTRIMARHSVLRAAPDGSDPDPELTVPQMNMLFVIRDRDHVSIKELAAALEVSAPSASAMVERLFEMGVVTREQNPADRREVIVCISPRAAEMVDAIEERILEGIVELLEKIGPDYAREWVEIYQRILEILAEEDVPAASGSRREDDAL